MTYHPGTCYAAQGFDYSPANIAQIPVKTVRKFGNTGWDERFYWKEGERVKAFQGAGKRVIGTFDIANHNEWDTMPDEEWRGYVERYVKDLPMVKVIEVGNEPGKSMIDGYFRKLKIASEVIREAGCWPLMGAPYPGAETAFLEAAQARGAFEWVAGVCLHPYAKTPADCLTKVKAVRTRLNGYGGRPSGLHLHLTEWGWGTTSGFFCVNEQTQALYITQAFSLFRTWSGPLKINNVLLYTFNDSEWDPHDCGVVRKDGTYKPAYSVLAAQ